MPAPCNIALNTSATLAPMATNNNADTINEHTTARIGMV
jgi:hypothetical protein